MKIEKLKKRISKDRPMSSISLRMPSDVIDDLKMIAPQLGFSGYQPLIRAYIGQGLREDLEAIEQKNKIDQFASVLLKKGVDDKLVKEALESISKSA